MILSIILKKGKKMNKKTDFNETILTSIRMTGFFGFYICLFIICILKEFFNFFQNISWWLIFSPILLSIGIAIFLFLFFIFFILFERKERTK